MYVVTGCVFPIRSYYRVLLMCMTFSTNSKILKQQIAVIMATEETYFIIWLVHVQRQIGGNSFQNTY